MEVDILMAKITIATLKCAREFGVEDIGLLEDWEELVRKHDALCTSDKSQGGKANE